MFSLVFGVWFGNMDKKNQIIPMFIILFRRNFQEWILSRVEKYSKIIAKSKKCLISTEVKN